MSNWLGTLVDFSDSEDKQAFKEFQLLPQGFYKAFIKNALVGTIGQKNTNALIVHFTLEDEKTDISNNYWLDGINEAGFKKDNFRNLLSRVLYSNLSYEDYKAMDQLQVNKELELFVQKMDAQTFIGKKFQVNIVQEPFISADKNGKIKFTDINLDPIRRLLPTKIANLIEKDEKEKRIKFEKMPVILFSNKISGYGIEFYNDYEEKERKNSKAYNYIQSLNSREAGGVDTLIGENEIPF